MSQILVMVATEPEIDNAQKVATLILEKKLAACISLKEISSTYFWEGKIVRSSEIEIVIKSIPKNQSSLIEILKKELTNDLPEIIFKYYDSESEYFSWVSSSIN